MAELQRSVASFRRQGSSGLVWNDKFLSAFQDPNNQTKPNNQQPPDPQPLLDRSRSTGSRPHRAVNVTLPPKDPPSPKVPTCGLCGFFGKQAGPNHLTNPKSKKRR
ncbi:uncharacterized protein At1g15400-like [Prosopis cineraria]|uniref:uncharacterized protein At1g15400-like n=1 Tax=Prosopis cineraria TaxID=364024 RepID=UPI00240FE5F9|nr:uncharacterized protein At1g15400-like [Prosopis cineraria]